MKASNEAAIFQTKQRTDVLIEALETDHSSGKTTPDLLHPLWPALARYSAGIGTDADAACLLDLAIHPEQCEAPLSWALQFMIRGDIIMPDGNIILLDELCAEAGVEPLPLLEKPLLGLRVIPEDQ